MKKNPNHLRLAATKTAATGGRRKSLSTPCSTSTTTTTTRTSTPTTRKKMPTTISLLLCVSSLVLYCCCSCVHGSTGTSSSSALATTTAAAAATTAAVTTGAKPSQNVAVQLVSYAKNSITRTIDGCGQLWTNHGKCNTIRKKITAYREDLKQEWEEMSVDGGSISAEQKQLLKTKVGGISFEEYSFLQKGKDDRGKVMNLLFLMWGAPRFLPYALLFNPEMLPSPFVSTDSSGNNPESIWAKQSRERSTAVIQTLIQMEKDSKVTPAMAKINIFGGKKREENKQQLSRLVELAGTYMSNRYVNASQILSQLDLYRLGSDDFDRAEKRLCQVPKPIVKGLSSVLGGSGIFSGLQPHFMTRGRVVGHIKKVAESDDFLVSNQVNLTTINRRLLQEACSDRMILTSPNNNVPIEDMRQNLAEWLDLTVTQPEARIKAANDECHYNDNLARMAMMAYNSCLSARDPRSTLKLPRLLYTGGSSSTSSKSSQQKNAGGGRSWGRLSRNKS